MRFCLQGDDRGRHLQLALQHGERLRRRRQLSLLRPELRLATSLPRFEPRRPERAELLPPRRPAPAAASPTGRTADGSWGPRSLPRLRSRRDYAVRARPRWTFHDQELGMLAARGVRHSPPVSTEISRGTCLTRRWYRGLRRRARGHLVLRSWRGAPCAGRRDHARHDEQRHDQRPGDMTLSPSGRERAAVRAEALASSWEARAGHQHGDDASAPH